MTDISSTLFGTGEFFQRDNFAPVTDELTEFDLPVEGAIPAELDGWYLRNGPNPRQATAHWFTGDGMIHGVRIEGGRAAWYRNRWSNRRCPTRSPTTWRRWAPTTSAESSSIR